MKTIRGASDAKALLDQCDTFLLDCDGVLWHGNTLIDGIKETLEFLRANGKRVLFVTNNSTKSRHSYRKKFQELGIPATVEEIFGSSYAAAYYLKHVAKFPEEKKAYIVGSGGIVDELTEQGISFVKDEDGEHMDEFAWDEVHPDPSIGAVIIGFDLHFNYKKLAKAHCYLRYNEDQCLFYATNTDATYPNASRLFPGTGCLVNAMSTAIGKEPLVFGKPHQPMLDCIVDRYHLVPERTCMVGDRLDTDIAFGKTGGFRTLLVLSGVTQLEDIQTSRTIPDYVANTFAALVSASPS